MERFIKKLTYANMGSKESQDLQLASWRLEKAAGICSSSEVGSLDTQEEPMFQFEAKGWKKNNVPV